MTKDYKRVRREAAYATQGATHWRRYVYGPLLAKLLVVLVPIALVVLGARWLLMNAAAYTAAVVFTGVLLIILGALLRGRRRGRVGRMPRRPRGMGRGRL